MRVKVVVTVVAFQRFLLQHGLIKVFHGIARTGICGGNQAVTRRAYQAVQTL